MTLNEKYRIHNKSKSYKSLLFFVIIATLFVFSRSFSRYLTFSKLDTNIDVASWKIKVNDREITQDTRVIDNEVTLVTTDNSHGDGILRPGQKGYFEFTINPQYTQVSLKYTVSIDTSNLPSTIQLKEYSVNDFNTKLALPANNKLDDTILLAGRDNLGNLDIRNYRVYWEWPAENGIISDLQDEYKVKLNVQVEQIINEV